MLAAIATSPQQAMARVVLSCGASFGKTFYLSAKNGGWQDDKISKGAYTFTVDDKGEWDILYNNTDGPPMSYRETGAALIRIQGDAENRHFMLLAAFPRDGVIDTFSVNDDPSDPSTRVLLWTSNKSNAGPISLTKISGMIAACN